MAAKTYTYMIAYTENGTAFTTIKIGSKNKTKKYRNFVCFSLILSKNASKYGSELGTQAGAGREISLSASNQWVTP